MVASIHHPTIFFKPDSDLQTGSVEIHNAGWGETRITPEELEEGVEKLETDINLMKKDNEVINKIVIYLQGMIASFWKKEKKNYPSRPLFHVELSYEREVVRYTQ